MYFELEERALWENKVVFLLEAKVFIQIFLIFKCSTFENKNEIMPQWYD